MKPEQWFKNAGHEEMIQVRKKKLVLKMSGECSRIGCVHFSLARKILRVNISPLAWAL